MKKHTLLLLTICFVLFITSCGSSVSSEDYASVVSENTSLKAEIESLTDKNQKLVDLNEELTIEKVEEFSNAAAVTWATASFGDNTICLSNEDAQYLQCLAGNTYAISDDGIAALRDDLITSMSTLSLLKDTIPYKTIFIKFLDPSGIYLLDVTLKTDGDSDILHSMMCNVIYIDTILSSFQNASN